VLRGVLNADGLNALAVVEAALPKADVSGESVVRNIFPLSLTVANALNEVGFLHYISEHVSRMRETYAANAPNPEEALL